jgi:hypothetical protein|tara:strand:- start:47 stop:271 length:225 start_codon:yes stop_codon:yes gene_type:complete
MEEYMSDAEKVELSTEELVKIANQLQGQVKQMDAMIKDLGNKVAQKEVENSQLRVVVQQIANVQQQTGADVEEE